MFKILPLLLPLVYDYGSVLKVNLTRPTLPNKLVQTGNLVGGESVVLDLDECLSHPEPLLRGQLLEGLVGLEVDVGSEHLLGLALHAAVDHGQDDPEEQHHDEAAEDAQQAEAALDAAVRAAARQHRPAALLHL